MDADEEDEDEDEEAAMVFPERALGPWMCGEEIEDLDLGLWAPLRFAVRADWELGTWGVEPLR